MRDPLTALREFHEQGKKVTVADSNGNEVDITDNFQYIKFDQSFVLRTTLTPYKSKRGSGSYYPIDAIYFCYFKRSISVTDYIQEARKLNILAVSLVDRKDLISHILGEIEQSKCIDLISQPPFKWITKEELGEQNEEVIMEQEVDDDKPLALNEILANERLVVTKESLFQCKNKDFSSCLKILKKVMEDEERNKRRKIVPDKQKGAAKTADPSSHSHSKKASSSLPLIIVPSAVTSLINMYNVKEFLEMETFSDQKASKKESSIVINRKKAGRTISYEVTDSVTRFKADDWERVVAVFALGPAWQFKGWKWDSPVEIFSHVKGFHLNFDDAKLDSNVKAWDITLLTISKNKRHLDASAVHQFWETVDTFVSKNKPHYLDQ